MTKLLLNISANFTAFSHCDIKSTILLARPKISRQSGIKLTISKTIVFVTGHIDDKTVFRDNNNLTFDTATSVRKIG